MISQIRTTCNRGQRETLVQKFFDNDRSQKVKTAHGEGLVTYTHSGFHTMRLSPTNDGNWSFLLECSTTKPRIPTDLQVSVVRKLYEIGCSIRIQFMEFPERAYTVIRPDQLISESSKLERLNYGAPVNEIEEELRLRLLLSATNMPTPYQDRIVSRGI